MNERLYLLKIELLDIEPSIWRRFVVPAGITLDRLHDAIQIVMGWTDSHLHEFTIGNKALYRISGIQRRRAGLRQIPSWRSDQTEGPNIPLPV